MRVFWIIRTLITLFGDLTKLIFQVSIQKLDYTQIWRTSNGIPLLYAVLSF